MSVRAELQDSVRMVAEAAAKPAAEAAARAVAEEVARSALAVAQEEEAASRQRIEESAIAVAEQVGRDLVKLAFEAARTGRPAATSEAGQTRQARRCGRSGPHPAAGTVGAGAAPAGLVVATGAPAMARRSDAGRGVSCVQESHSSGDSSHGVVAR